MRSAPLHPSLFSFLFPAALSLGACGSWSAPFKEKRVIEVDWRGPAPLEVRTENGSITVRKGKEAVIRIEAEIRARNEERLAAVEIVTTRKADRTLRVGVVWPEGGREGAEGVRFEITLPLATALDLETRNGKIRAAGMRGKARCRTSNGSILLEDHEGPVTASTTNGRILLKGVGTPLEAKTSNGALEILLRPSATGPVSARTTNGGIRLRLGSAFRGFLRTSTTNGRILIPAQLEEKTTRSGRHRAILRFGAEEPVSRLRTSNGTIRIGVD